MSELKKIISNCPLCEEHSLHVIGSETEKMQQCISCGYVTSSKFKGTKEDNEEYKNLTDDMKKWSKETLGSIWIPSIFTLPDSLIYPDDINGEMKWKLAEMIDIPKEEQKNYPIENQENQYYERMYDVDNAKIFDSFLESMVIVNKKSKEKGSKIQKIQLPKLK